MAMKTETPRSQPHPGTMTCEFNQIEVPGLYLEITTGSLLRVPEDARMPGHHHETRQSSKPRLVTRISDDPFLETSRARMLAADMDFETVARPRILPRRQELQPPPGKKIARSPRRKGSRPRRAALR